MPPPPIPRARKILYAGDLNPGGTCLQRLGAIQRLGQYVYPFDISKYRSRYQAVNWLSDHYPIGPLVSALNRGLLRAIQEYCPEVVWFDKPIFFTPDTMHAIKKSGAQIAFYVQDSPFGPRNDGCWRQFLNIYRMADLHCLFREADVLRYRDWGLPFARMMFSFEPSMHFPPPVGFNDAGRTREVSYIGHPHEQRPAFLLKIAREHQLPTFVNGNRWDRTFSSQDRHCLTLGGFLANDEYRSAIWQSKINLSFVTEDNEDDIAHKAIETAACGGFLLALRTPGHQATFEEDREAVFFTSVEECADKCRFYLDRPDLREAIAARGHERAVRSGYDNDTQLARVLNRLDEIRN